MRLKYRVFAATHVGRVRANQEDAVAVAGLDDVRPAEAVVEHNRACWALVADGIGGNVAGEVASELTVAMLAGVMDKVTTSKNLRTYVKMVNDELIAIMGERPAFRGMGTTIVGAVVRSEHCLLFNLGDSRAYVFDGDELTRASRDHSEEGYLIGFMGGSGAPLIKEPHIRAEPVSRGVKIILCTDGLTNMLSDDEIRLSLKARHAQPAKALVDAAVTAGGHDNVSVVVISCEEGNDQ